MGIAGKTEGIPTVPDPDEEMLGPAMRALTGPQRRFAVAAVMFPLAKDFQIARAAGYSAFSHGSLRVAAHKNFHDERILAAIKELADKEIRGTALLGIAVMKKIARLDGHKDQLKAAEALVGLAGFTIEQNINVNQTVTDHSGKGILKRIEELANRLGVPKAGLLGGPAPVVEGEFSEVENG